MADRTRELYPLSALFSPGEQPSGAKLTAISTQAKAGIDKLSYIVGDLWNAAGDQVLSPSGNITKYALHIPNLARAIGSLAALNPIVPAQPPLDTSMLYTDAVGITYQNQNYGLLTYAPAITPSNSNMILGGTFTPLVQLQFKTNPAALSVVGDWSVDVHGRLYTFDPIPVGLHLIYQPTINTPVTAYDTTNEPGWNVIPDPAAWSAAYPGLKISFANNTDATGGYHIWMPPRTSLTGSRQLFNVANPISENIQVAPDSGPFLAFQDPTSDAAVTNGNHYRYNLPNEITSGAANSQLPTGFLFLWDEQFGTIVDNVTYFTPANTAHSKFKIRIVGSDLANVFGNTIGAGILTDDTTQLPADYIARFKLITVGTSLAKAVSSLIMFAANHNHLNIAGSKAISHSQLDNLVTPANTIAIVGAGSAPVYPPSAWINDDHSQYLHRGGSRGTNVVGGARDLYDNALFGYLKILDIGGDTIGNLDMHLDISTGLVTTTAKATIVANNGGLELSSFGTGQSSNYSTQRAGLFIGGQENIGWGATVINNGDSLSLRGGGTTGIAQLVNAQFQKLYLGLDTTFVRQTSALDWNNSTQTLTLEAASSLSAFFTTDNVTATNILEGNTVKADLKFTYNTPKMQYLFISPHNIQIPQGSSADLNITSLGIINTSTSNIYTLYTNVALPDGVALDTSTTTCRMLSTGNGTTGVQVILIKNNKPAISSDTFAPTVNLLNMTGSASASFSVTNSFYLSSHVVANGLTGASIYTIAVILPVLISGNFPQFNGITLSYLMTDLNN